MKLQFSVKDGRGGTDGWSVQCVRPRGSAQAFGVVKEDGRSGRTRAGKGYQGVFPLMHQDLICVTSLLAKSFVTIISF